MKHLKILMIMALCVSALRINAQIVKHTNPVVAEEINSSTMWFVTTSWYESAGVKIKDNLQRYSTYEDSLVQAVHKEESIPFIPARNAYLNRSPERYNFTPWELSLKRETMGTTGIFSQGSECATYTEAEQRVTSKHVLNTIPTNLYSIWLLGLLTIVALTFISFKNDQSHFVYKDEDYFDRLVKVAGWLIPALLFVANMSINQATGEEMLGIYLCHSDGLKALLAVFGVFIALFCIISTIEDLVFRFPIWTIVILSFIAFEFYAFTHDVAIVGIWFFLGLISRGFAYVIVQIIEVVKERSWRVA